MAGMLAAVWWALENRDRLGAQVALQCLGMLIVSVAGQFVFQYLVDIKMDAEGFHVFRDLRLRVGDRLKGAPMEIFLRAAALRHHGHAHHDRPPTRGVHDHLHDRACRAASPWPSP